MTLLNSKAPSCELAKQMYGVRILESALKNITVGSPSDRTRKAVAATSGLPEASREGNGLGLDAFNLGNEAE